MIQIQFDTPAFVKNGEVVTIRYANGSTQDFNSIAEFQSYHQGVLDAFGEDGLKALAVINRLAGDVMMDSPEKWNGKIVKLDPEQQASNLVFTVT